MKTLHTPGPWIHKRETKRGEFVVEDHIRLADGGHIAEVGPMAPEANAARIVACVNACEGYRPEMVREAIEMLKSIVKTCPETLRALRIDAAKTVAMLEEK